jgi:mxaJ protein
MYLRCLEAAFASAAFALAIGGVYAAERELRVCADPDNLPYSREDGSGFENRIAQILAEELGAKLTYTWFPQRRSFLRNTLNAGVCDLIIGVPTAFEPVRTTVPYYRSTYVFVFRADAPAPFRSFDDPHLKRAKVGVQLIGDDLAATPPGHALALRRIVENVVGFPIYGERPQAELMIEALVRGELDVALLWGPQAAFYARRESVRLEIAPASPPAELVGTPFEFSMSMGVRKSDEILKAELDRVIELRRADLDRVLRDYGIPRSDVAVVTRASDEMR